MGRTERSGANFPEIPVIEKEICHFAHARNGGRGKGFGRASPDSQISLALFLEGSTACDQQGSYAFTLGDFYR